MEKNTNLLYILFLIQYENKMILHKSVFALSVIGATFHVFCAQEFVYLKYRHATVVQIGSDRIF